MRLLASTVLLSTATLGLSYTWPDPKYEAWESIIYEGRTTAGSSLSFLVHPCKKRVGTLASVPAEWLRFAFHDMATHDADTGTGGMDGSIVYELGRPENNSGGLNQTLGDFENFPNKYLSRADIIAVGAILAVSSCGGPIIPFHAGRIDTFEAGGFGTPEPQHDLATLTESFRKQGFSQGDMIKLVACGHTMGGVRDADFPQLVPPSSDSGVTVIQDFDTSMDFDNKVVTEYLDGTTQNVLVVSPNTTFVSDLRVFEADNNSTMRSIASPDAFRSECQKVLTRMLDVVPRGVELSDEVTMIPAKVKNAQLVIEKDKLVFKSTFRLAQEIAKPASKDRVVTLFWCDRYGSNKDCSASSRSSAFVKKLAEDPNLSPVTNKLGFQFNSYDFVVPIDPDQSISKFWFQVDEKDGSTPKEYRNDGNDYVIDQDQVIFVPTMSKVDVISNGTYTKVYTNRDGEAFHRIYQLVVGVREDVNPDRVYVDGFDSSVLGFAYAVNHSIDLALNSTHFPNSQGYKFYTGFFESSGLQLTIDVHAEVKGKTYSMDFVQTSALDNTPIVAPGTVMTGGKPSSDGSGAESLLAGGWIHRLGLGAVVIGVLSTFAL